MGYMKKEKKNQILDQFYTCNIDIKAIIYA